MKRLGQSLRVMVAIYLLVKAFSLPENSTDRLSLLALKAKVDKDPFGLLNLWNDSINFCSWPGVTCSRRHHQRVTMVNLLSWQLKGQLSPHIGNLSFLRRLGLDNNSFGPDLPPEIEHLSRLRRLSLENNSFISEIPANICRCSSLRYLSVLNNSFTGGIPKDLGSLTELRVLDLSKNTLVGEIPASVGNLSYLLYLDLGSNILWGNIPYSFGQLKSLKELRLGENKLRGTVPLSMYNISTIENFSLHNNNLEGSLPPNLGHKLPNLKNFLFNSNNFSGSIPASASNFTNLILFQISYNKFTGKVPSFAKSSNLKFLILSNNSLGYAENDDLNFLNDLVNCTGLEMMSFPFNNLGGSIPDSISNMTSISRLGFGGNQISGNIPSGIGQLVNLQVLIVDHNHLTGPIPRTIGQLREIYALSFFDNKLSGTIPTTLQNLTLLSKLYLGRNNIQGKIPTSLGEGMNLQELILGGNNLSGTIPLQLISMSSLTIALDLSQNQLTGSIPAEVGKLENLRVLDISENLLSGEIPKFFGSCKSIEYLFLEGNFLDGQVPEELESLRGIDELDLSRNKLSGKIPEYFSGYGALSYLNLSFNEFEGQVPQKGVFQNMSKFSVVGNTRLCGGLPELRLPKCTYNIDKKHKLSHQTKLIIIVVCAVLGLIMILFLVTLSVCSRKKRGKEVLEPSLGISLPRISYGDLFKATDGFSSKNLIGVGSFGSVYKGIFTQEDTLLAVKVFNLQVSHSLKSFIAECESLRIIKHRNLVKILTVCSGIDFQGNDFKAIVYEFMENGNLEEWLHYSSDQIMINTSQDQSQSRSLNLIQRVNIVSDVATAIDYLHNHCPESIAHCDIKPSNILLDGDMVAHVGDFGLTKLLKNDICTTSNQSSSIGLRGTVGYIAPEYAMGSEVSTSGDIYSFGILLLEIFTGKRPTERMFKDELNLNNFVSEALPEHISEVLDPKLLVEERRSSTNIVCAYDAKDQTVRESLVSILEIGVACSSAFPGVRRNIGDVAAELHRVKNILGAHRRPPNRAWN